MIRLQPTLYFVCVLVAAAGATAKEPTTKRLFDGKSFTGWEGNLELFRIEDGSIVGGTMKRPIRRNEFLCTQEEFADFELRLEFKLVGALTNGGVQFRSRRIPNHHEVKGYQADAGQVFWGCLYDESRRNKVLASPLDKTKLDAAVRKQDWNRYRIRCEGPHIQLWLNDVLTVDYTEPDDKIEQRGVIGLQIHSGQPSETWYRNIEITAW
jgi:hypothetical protein